MPLIIPSGFSQVIHSFHTPGPGGGHMSSISYGVTASPSIAGAELLEGLFEGNWAESFYQPLVSQGTVMQNDAEGFYFSSGWDPGRTGAIAPPQVASLVRKRTALRGKENQGRMYFPCLLSDGEIDDSGNISSGTFTDLITHADEWLAGLDLADLTMCILHTTSSDPTPVLALSVDQTIATQRRRLR